MHRTFPPKTKPIDPVPPAKPTQTPLYLRRFTRAEGQARNAIAQKLQDVALAGPSNWRLSLVPLGEQGPLRADAGQWLLRANLAGAAFEVLLSQAAAQSWIGARFPDIDAPALPVAYAAVVLEAACADFMGRVSRLGLGDVKVEFLAHGPAEGAALAHVFAFHLRAPGRTVLGQIACDSTGLMLLAGLSSELPLATGPVAGDRLPIVLRAEVGCTWLSATEIRQLTPGDAVLIEQVLLTAEGELWVGVGDWGLRSAWNDRFLTVTTALNRKGWTMPDHDGVARGDQALDMLDDLPLRLAFDLGERSVTLGELRHLQVGQTIDMGHPLSAAVSLRVNGALVGAGEIIEIDERLAVSITSLSGLSPPTPESDADLEADDLDESADGGEE